MGESGYREKEGIYFSLLQHTDAQFNSVSRKHFLKGIAKGL